MKKIMLFLLILAFPVNVQAFDLGGLINDLNQGLKQLEKNITQGVSNTNDSLKKEQPTETLSSRTNNISGADQLKETFNKYLSYNKPKSPKFIGCEREYNYRPRDNSEKTILANTIEGCNYLLVKEIEAFQYEVDAPKREEAEKSRIAKVQEAEKFRIAKVQEAERLAIEEANKIAKNERLAREEAFQYGKAGNPPDQQVRFVKIIQEYSGKYKTVKNNMKKALLKKKRKNELKYLFGDYGQKPVSKFEEKLKRLSCEAEGMSWIYCNSGNITETAEWVKHSSINWVGEVVRIDSDSRGNGSIKIKLPSGIMLTNREDFSPDQPLYETLSNLNAGDKIIFNGKMGAHIDSLMSKGWFLHSTNTTQDQAMLTPNFSFWFDIITVR